MSRAKLGLAGAAGYWRGESVKVLLVVGIMRVIGVAKVMDANAAEVVLKVGHLPELVVEAEQVNIVGVGEHGVRGRVRRGMGGNSSGRGIRGGYG